MVVLAMAVSELCRRCEHSLWHHGALHQHDYCIILLYHIPLQYKYLYLCLCCKSLKRANLAVFRTWRSMTTLYSWFFVLRANDSPL